MLQEGEYNIYLQMRNGSKKGMVSRGLMSLRKAKRRYPFPKDKRIMRVLFYGAIKINNKNLGLRFCPEENAEPRNRKQNRCGRYPSLLSCVPSRAGVLVYLLTKSNTIKISVGNSINDLVRGGVLDGWGETIRLTRIDNSGFCGLREGTVSVSHERPDCFCAFRVKEKTTHSLCDLRKTGKDY